jgi:hypothetical protein
LASARLVHEQLARALAAGRRWTVQSTLPRFSSRRALAQLGFERAQFLGQAETLIRDSGD